MADQAGKDSIHYSRWLGRSSHTCEVQAFPAAWHPFRNLDSCFSTSFPASVGVQGRSFAAPRKAGTHLSDKQLCATAHSSQLETGSVENETLETMPNPRGKPRAHDVGGIASPRSCEAASVHSAALVDHPADPLGCRIVLCLQKLHSMTRVPWSCRFSATSECKALAPVWP